MLADIFLSYSREDKERIRSLVEKLEHRGWSVWWDGELVPGEKFESVIRGQIQASKCVIVIWSKSSVESVWVKREAKEGYDLGKLIPAMIDDVDPPWGISDLDAAKLFPWPKATGNEEFGRFLNAVENKAGSFLYKNKEQMTEEIISEIKSSHHLLSKRFFWVVQFSMFVIGCISIYALMSTLKSDDRVSGLENEIKFGGTYQVVEEGKDTTYQYPNPVTDTFGCPDEYKSYRIGSVRTADPAIAADQYVCIKSP